MLQGVQIFNGNKEKALWVTEEFPNFYLDPYLKVPKELSFCFRFFLDFGTSKAVRSSKVSLFQVWTHNLKLVDNGGLSALEVGLS